MVLNGITVRGSIVGTRLVLQESLDFAARGKVKATVSTEKLEDINDVFARMHRGEIEGRVVLDLASDRRPQPSATIVVRRCERPPFERVRRPRRGLRVLLPILLIGRMEKLNDQPQ